ncbi:MAG: OmpH family outer membrane protein [Polyangiaceae bacterium]
MKLRSLSSLLVSSALLLGASSAFAETKVAVVDVDRAVSSTEEGLRAAADLKKMFESKQQELNKKQSDLQKQQEEIIKQEKVISKEAAQKRKEEWQRQMMELQAVFVEYNKDLEQKQKARIDPIVQKMLEVVRRVASTDAFDLVVERRAAAFVRADLDITDRCIQLYNSGGGGGAPAPKGSQPQAPTAPPAPKK